MAKQETKQPFKMNLQLFADNNTPSQADLQAQAMQILQGGAQPIEGAALQGQPQQIESNPQNSPQNSQNSGQIPGQTPNQDQAQGQPNQAPQDAQGQMLLGKFKSPDELANGYVNLERGYTQTRQELSAKDQQIQAMQAAINQMQQQMQSVVNPQEQEPQLTPEEQNENFMNSFYENPMTAIQSIIEKAVMPQIQPIQQQYQAQQQQQVYNQALNQFAQQTPDFEQFKPAIAEVLSKNPELNGHPGGPIAAINIAYNMAKGQQYQNPNDLLQNQDFVNNNILNNKEIENQFIQRYLQSLKQNNQAPVVISGQANGSTPVVPENRPQSADEARAMAMKIMQG